MKNKIINLFDAKLYKFIVHGVGSRINEDCLNTHLPIKFQSEDDIEFFVNSLI